MNQTKYYALFLPNALVASRASQAEIVAVFNAWIDERGGMVLYDGQILCERVTEADIVETILDEPLFPCDYPCREWGSVQADYFDIRDPFQMSEARGTFGANHLLIRDRRSYLSSGEWIIGLVHGGRDQRVLYCTCHSAQVVYTSAHRLVCMSCGMLHCVLRESLSGIAPGRTFVEDEWFEYFSSDGLRRDDEVELALVDFQDVERAPKLWETQQWEVSAADLVFFARSTEEDLEAHRRASGTIADWLDAGFQILPTALPPALQLSDESLSFDLLENAEAALQQAARAFRTSRDDPSHLRHAILSMFQATELLLKLRLDELEPGVLAGRLNTPSLIERLERYGARLEPHEKETVNALRRLRNALQHGAAKFGYRSARTVLRRTLVFLDRFSHEELGLWIADALPKDDWRQLLRVPEIQYRAETISAQRIASSRTGSTAVDVSQCAVCGRVTIVRLPESPRRCLYCQESPAAVQGRCLGDQ